MYEGYLVKSVFSKNYFSYNTLEYYNLIQQIKKPWYYDYIEYIPSNNNYIDRHLLKNYDLELFKYHIKALRIWKTHNKFYLLLDNNLSNSISNLWIEILNDPSITRT